MPSAGPSTRQLPQYNPNNPPPLEGAIPRQDVENAVRAHVNSLDTPQLLQVAMQLREGVYELPPQLARLAGLAPRRYARHARHARNAPGFDFLTLEEEVFDPLPLYTKLPSADEMTVKLSPLEQLPNYHDVVPTDDVVAGRKRKRKERDLGRRVVKRRILGIKMQVTRDSVSSLLIQLNELSLL